MIPPRVELARPGVVAVPVAAAVLCEALAWALALRADTLGAGAWLGFGDLLAAVHLLTVGTLGLAIVGTGWQLVPVVAAAPAPRWWERVAALVDGLLLPGVALLVGGLLWPGPWLGLGAGLLVAGLGLRALAVGTVLVRASGRPVARGWLVAAELALAGGLVLGLLLALTRAGLVGPVPLVAMRLDAIGRHAALLLAGWVGGWMVGVGSVLLPMFAVSREPRALPLGIAGVAWFAGLFLADGRLWVMGAVLAALTLGHGLARGVRTRRDPGLLGVFVALLALAAVAMGLASGAPPTALVAAGLLLWALPLLRGVAMRLVPFLIWVHLLGASGPRAPQVASLVPAHLPAAAVLLGIAGGVLVVLTIAGVLPDARPGAALGLCGALVTLSLLLSTTVRALAARRRLQSLPGMESP